MNSKSGLVHSFDLQGIGKHINQERAILFASQLVKWIDGNRLTAEEFVVRRGPYGGALLVELPWPLAL